MLINKIKNLDYSITLDIYICSCLIFLFSNDDNKSNLCLKHSLSMAVFSQCLGDTRMQKQLSVRALPRRQLSNICFAILLQALQKYFIYIILCIPFNSCTVFLIIYLFKEHQEIKVWVLSCQDLKFPKFSTVHTYNFLMLYKHAFVMYFEKIV